jgi:glycosyltransferase involved in cell wall biosynthesis
MANSGDDVDVFFSWGVGAQSAAYDPEFGLNIKWDTPLLSGYPSVFLKNLSPRPSGAFFGQINPAIFGYLKRKKYDAFVVLGWNALTNWIAVFYASARGIPVFLRGENPLSHEYSHSAVKRFVKRILLKALFSRIDHVLYIGEENRKFYEFYGVPAEKLVFAPYAVENERFIAAATELKARRNELRAAHGFSPGQPIILFVGKLIEKKRPMDLLDAYGQFVERTRRVGIRAPGLVFVGSGMLQHKLELYVSRMHLDEVRFVGFKNQTELPELYALGDVLVLPSGLGETWGLVVNEAMCFGVPIIVSDHVGCGPDLVKEGENGFIVPVRDIRVLSSRIEELMSDPRKRERFGERSRAIISRYDYQADISAIHSCLS